MDPWERPPVHPLVRAVRAVASLGVVAGILVYLLGWATGVAVVQSGGISLVALFSLVAGTLNLAAPRAAYYVGAAGDRTEEPTDRRLTSIRLAGVLYLLFAVGLGWVLLFAS